MNYEYTNGMYRLRLQRLEQAERAVSQARSTRAKIIDQLAALRLEKEQYMSERVKREDNLFKEFSVNAVRADSLNRYRHMMSNIVEEGIKIDQRINDATKEESKAVDAVSEAKKKHVIADRNLRKYKSMLDFYQREKNEFDRLAEERETDEWLSQAAVSRNI